MHLRRFVELMLLGFVSLLLVVSQDLIQKICIDDSLMEHWMPCRGASATASAHYGVSSSSSSSAVGGGRRMLKGGGAAFGHCSSKVSARVISGCISNGLIINAYACMPIEFERSFQKPYF